MVNMPNNDFIRYARTQSQPFRAIRVDYSVSYKCIHIHRRENRMEEEADGIQYCMCAFVEYMISVYRRQTLLILIYMETGAHSR